MKIVIFAGGTGSIALQKGLFKVFGKDALDYTIITNLADNGLSTGQCREVLDGKIMGPSDLRKNQMLRAELAQSASPNLLAFLNKRITVDMAAKAEKTIIDNLYFLHAQKDLSNDNLFVLVSATATFFSMPKAQTLEYSDFSIANIIYTGLAALQNNSLSAAGKIMASILGIPEDAVLASSDQPMYLQATTASGHVIEDEGDIVRWNNPEDKIVGCHYVDREGNRTKPFLAKQAMEMVMKADLIIYSTGTQWSSLIPTYISEFLPNALFLSTAKKYLVMNGSQDADIKGVSGNELLSTLDHYLRLETTKIVFATDGQRELIPTQPHRQYLSAAMCEPDSHMHKGDELVTLIMEDYFSDALKSDNFVFDYDDTLVARKGANESVSDSNIQLFNKIDNSWIHTGNTIVALSKKIKNKNVIADGGVNYYIKNGEMNEFLECLAPRYLFTTDDLIKIFGQIQGIGIDIERVTNRGNVMVSIRPLDPEVRALAHKVLSERLWGLDVRLSGKSTIDICKKGMSKASAVHAIPGRITFVGDEFGEGGNDRCMLGNASITTIPVKSINDTNMFLTILHRYQESAKQNGPDYYRSR